MLEHAQAERERITIVCSIPEPAWELEGAEGEGPAPADWNNKIHVGEWNECPDGRLWRMVYVPPGMEWPAKDPASCVEIAKGEGWCPRPRPVELPALEED